MPTLVKVSALLCAYGLLWCVFWMFAALSVLMHLTAVGNTAEVTFTAQYDCWRHFTSQNLSQYDRKTHKHGDKFLSLNTGRFCAELLFN